MTSQSRDTGNSQFFADDLSADTLREQLLKAQMDAAREPAITTALELFSFMSALPDAFVASQQREAKRLQKLGRDKDPRIEALKVSIEESDKLRATARLGQVRLERALAALSAQNDVFHGFVSDTELQFQKGYTVRLVGVSDTDGKSRVSATTESDGYFSITLKARETASGFAAKDETQANLFVGMFELFGKTGRAAAAATEASATSPITESAKASVEILDPNGQRVHQDPVPIIIDSGSVYREYIIDSKGSRSDRQRYVGNPATRELHDTEKLTKRCNFDAIKPNVRVYFDSTAAADKAGYDYCAYCFGKAKSKH